MIIYANSYGDHPFLGPVGTAYCLVQEPQSGLRHVHGSMLTCGRSQLPLSSASARRRQARLIRARVLAAAVDHRQLDAQVAVVLGTQWGDEGKGKLVDILAQQYDIVARAQVCHMSFLIDFLFLATLPSHFATKEKLVIMPGQKEHVACAS
jgi:hypothetical protein